VLKKRSRAISIVKRGPDLGMTVLRLGHSAGGACDSC